MRWELQLERRLEVETLADGLAAEVEAAVSITSTLPSLNPSCLSAGSRKRSRPARPSCCSSSSGCTWPCPASGSALPSTQGATRRNPRRLAYRERCSDPYTVQMGIRSMFIDPQQNSPYNVPGWGFLDIKKPSDFFNWLLPPCTEKTEVEWLRPGRTSGAPQLACARAKSRARAHRDKQ